VLESAPQDLYMWVDSDRLLQVVTNLLSNASKFSPPGESVVLGAEASESHVRIMVRDRGPGVAPEFRGRIFQRFAQAESLDQRRRSGSGLGLSISKALIERMAGEIGYESAEGAGTVFFVSVPRTAGVGTPHREQRAQAQ
jgi:signal transduction histidine kinase